MTQQQLTDIEANRTEARILKLRIEQAKQRTHDILKTCDHKNPDGSSAWESGWMYDYCKICSYSN